MKQAKATNQDIEYIWEFLRMIDEVLVCGTYTHSDGSEEQVNDERFRDIVSQFFEGDFVDPKPSLTAAFYLVIYGYQTLVENCCDPELNYLEWRPDVKQFLDEQTNKLNEQNIHPQTDNSTKANQS